MLTVSKSKLKTHMLQIFRQIEQTGEEVIVTDKKRPVLRIQSIPHGRRVEELFAPFKGKVVFYEDPNAPVKSGAPENLYEHLEDA
jgi:antitoxin (DNA-binding transcriptional repressor) of toxin-antitoxin stability system